MKTNLKPNIFIKTIIVYFLIYGLIIVWRIIHLFLVEGVASGLFVSVTKIC